MQINHYNDFVTALKTVGMSLGGENDEGIFALSTYFSDAIHWHCDTPEVDPWEWRIRVLEEQEDIGYGKIFFKKSGFITREWAPHFIAVRRRGMDFHEAYRSGTIGHMEKRIYEVFEKESTLPLHEIKRRLGITKEESAAFDKALTELQMRFYLTLCGRQQKTNKEGEGYGWSSTVLCTVEAFWGEALVDEASKLDIATSEACIADQVKHLNPNFNPKKLMKFIRG